MTAKILQSFGSKIAERWAATIFTPAFVFWFGGLVVMIQRFGWKFLVKKFISYPEPLQIAILVGCLGVIFTSAFVVQRFDMPTLRFLEGYWYLWWLRSLRLKHYRKYKEKLEKRKQELRDIEKKNHIKFKDLKKKIDD